MQNVLSMDLAHRGYFTYQERVGIQPKTDKPELFQDRNKLLLLYADFQGLYRIVAILVLFKE